jgi:hypothetical protein
MLDIKNISRSYDIYVSIKRFFPRADSSAEFSRGLQIHMRFLLDWRLRGLLHVRIFKYLSFPRLPIACNSSVRS